MDSASFSQQDDITASTTMVEAFAIWRDNCLTCDVPSEDRKNVLRSQSSDMFASKISRNEIKGEETLAKLIKELGPPLTSEKLPSRICALTILCGAIEGCHGSTTTTISDNVFKLLGSFLLGQCGPIQHSNESIDDYDEQVRDASILGLTALMKFPLILVKKDGKVELDALETSIQMRLDFAKKGVEHRCASSDQKDEMEYDHGFESPKAMQQQNNVQGGLSMLPRSRRSLCFSLLQSTVNSVIVVAKEEKSLPIKKVASQLENTFVSFILFSVGCLQGETDPRCIMQLLVFFHTIQITFGPLFLFCDASTFPITQLFDGVAPYYPIQFTPPPNDIHGITRDGLRKALMAVLCYYELDELAARDSKDTMHSLSLGIILERLLPVDGDYSEVAQTVEEKLEAVEELKMVLFPADNDDSSSTCNRMTASMMQQISAALIMVHKQSSIAVARGAAEGEDGDQYKKLADTVRTLVSKVAYQTERGCSKLLWESFVMESLQSLSPNLNSPSRGQTAIAYIACLAASGGLQTLQNSLESGLNPLIENLRLYQEQDEETISTAAYGIGAFFSSCRVAMEKSSEDGVVLHPHPLKPYSSKVFEGLYSIFQDTTSPNEYKTTLATRIASVRALESVLIVTPSEHFTSDDKQKICDFIETLKSSVLNINAMKYASTDSEEIQWRKACTQTLGSLLGTSLASSCVDDGHAAKTTTTTTNALEEESIKGLLQGSVCIELVSSTKNDMVQADSSLPRFDRIALAIACNTNLLAARVIIESLLQSLNDSLQKNIVERSTEVCAEALSFLLRHGGNTTARAFHEVSSPTSDDIYESLCSLLVGDSENPVGGQIEDGVSALKLPVTEEERQATYEKINKVFEIVSYLLPAYQQGITSKEISNLASKVAKVFPPLSDKDNMKLLVLLPLLSAALKHNDQHEQEGLSATYIDKLIAVGPDLTGFALNTDNDKRARSAAASCIHSSIVQSIPKGETDKCPSWQLMKLVIVPLMLSSVDNVSSDPALSMEGDERNNRFEIFIDCLNMAALVGSAAACRGGSSSSTADAIAAFFVELACTKKAHVPCTDSDTQIDLATNHFDGYETMLMVAAASAFGSMLATIVGGPICKQRITHKTIKYLQPTINDYGEMTTLQTSPVGPLAIICHLICSSTVRHLDRSTQYNIARLIVRGLSPGVFYTVEPNSGTFTAHADLCSVKKLFLASLLKLLCENQMLLFNEIAFVTTGLIRAYAITVSSDDLTTEITSKLLALQALERVPHVHNTRQILQAIKPVVVSMLSTAMNHPSRLLRQAAVHVRNAWFTVA